MELRLRRLFLLLLISLVAGVSAIGYTSLVGPWFRYDCDNLGFEIPISSGWTATPVPDGVVFAMQTQPDPYVRVAVGRIETPHGSIEPMIQEELQQAAPSFKRSRCQVDGHEAIRIEGKRRDGGFMDVFVKKAPYWYWIGFAADNEAAWPQYHKTFDIVLDGFRFI